MTLRIKVYSGQEHDSLALQAEAEGHVVQVVVEDEHGNVVSSFLQTDNERSEFSDLDFLNPEGDDEEEGDGNGEDDMD